jgi:hypothetical protein
MSTQLDRKKPRRMQNDYSINDKLLQFLNGVGTPARRVEIRHPAENPLAPIS